jgi:hypothetical protein
MTAQQLCDRCAALGAPGITTNVLANIETRRRDVSVDELLVLALALDVAPMHLLAPDGAVRLAITPTASVTESDELRRWLRGEQALPQSQTRLYYEYALQYQPPADGDATLSQYARTVLQDAAQRLATQYESEATEFVTNVRGQVRDLLVDLQQALRDGVEADELLRAIDGVKQRLRDGRSSTKVARAPRRRA